MSKMQKVFVYGTLKRGEPNHSWILDASKGVSKFLYEAVTLEKYPLIIGTRFNIPFLLDVPGRGHNVKGELYEVDESMLKHLDVLEDHPNFYIREMREVCTELTDLSQSSKEMCWMYLIKSNSPQLLEEPYLAEYHSQGEHGKPYTERDEDHANLSDLLSPTKYNY